MKVYRFTAKLKPARGGGAYILFPYDIEQEFGTKGRVPVNAQFNDAPYKACLLKYGHPQHMLPAPKAVREVTRKAPGDTANIELSKDEELRTVQVPPVFRELMEKQQVLPIFERLSYTHRREYCRWRNRLVCADPRKPFRS
jgi:hypothetical protein